MTKQKNVIEQTSNEGGKAQVFAYYDRQGFCPNAECVKRGMTQVCDATGATLAIRCEACGYWRRF